MPDHISEIEIDFDSSADEDHAGMGLRSFPLLNTVMQTDHLLDWEMSPSEKLAVIFLVEHLKPKVAIEVGTNFGGSLQVLSRFCESVYSIDIDPNVPSRLHGKFPNVEYLTGRSDYLLPLLVDKLQREQAELSFALIDGDHSTDGVRKDIENLLRYRPIVPMYIIMHDSFNPQCRLGIKQANWSANRNVHAVELDLVAGVVHSAPKWRDQLWGGLAMAILLPVERREHLEITGRAERTYNVSLASLQSALKRKPGLVHKLHRLANLIKQSPRR